MATPPSPPDEPPAPPGGTLPPEEPPQPPPPAGAEAGDCPRCGTPFRSGQEYCLECGLRLPISGGTVALLGRAWRRALPWYPGDWVWPVLLGLVVAALGAAAAIHFSPSESSPHSTIVATGPISNTVATTIQPPEEPTATTPTTPTTTTKPPVPPPRPKTVRSWPTGTGGWTVVLNSVPSSGGRGVALAEARRALRAGVTDVGVLNSSSYSSLHPGYYVVFSGVYGSQAQAQSGVAKARAHGYRTAYPRRITP